jgi:hypothetical protein
MLDFVGFLIHPVCRVHNKSNIYQSEGLNHEQECISKHPIGLLDQDSDEYSQNYCQNIVSYQTLSHFPKEKEGYSFVPFKFNNTYKKVVWSL